MSKHHEFPKMFYAKGKEPVIVNSQKEADELGKGWSDKPVVAKGDRGDKVNYNTGAVSKNDAGANSLEALTKRVALLERAVADFMTDDEPETEEAAPAVAPVEAEPTQQFGADEYKGTDAKEGIHNS